MQSDFIRTNRVSAVTIDAALDLKGLSQRDQEQDRREVSRATTLAHAMVETACL
jgi:hypothetical protein